MHQTSTDGNEFVGKKRKASDKHYPSTVFGKPAFSMLMFGPGQRLVKHPLKYFQTIDLKTLKYNSGKLTGYEWYKPDSFDIFLRKFIAIADINSEHLLLTTHWDHQSAAVS